MLHLCRPVEDCWYAQSSLEQFCLSAGKRPCIRKALAAVVAGEDDDRVLEDAVGTQCLCHTADLKVHALNHALICFLRAAIEIGQPATFKALRFRLVSGSLPRPVRGIEVQAEEE